MADSFPCIICGGTLERESDEYEGQPADGVMCSTRGNYGSTVYDAMTGEYLAFNICDPCLVERGKMGRLFATRSSIPVQTDVVIGRSRESGFGAPIIVKSIVGYQTVERPYIPWHQGMPEDEAACYIPIEELLNPLPKNVHLNFEPQSLVDDFNSQMDET